MEVLGLICILLAAILIAFAIMQLIFYCGRKNLKKSEEELRKAKEGFVNCLTCKHFRCRCVNIDKICNEKEYCYVCELSGKIMPYNINEEMTELLIPQDCCPLINKERKNSYE